MSINAERAVVTKRYQSWNRDEPAREWRALSLLAEYAPGLAPEPLRASLDAEPPEIEMSLLPGAQLGDAPLSAAQARALARALERLWQSVPPQRHRESGRVAMNAAVFARQVRAGLQAGHDLGDDPLVRRAAGAATSWLDSGAIAGDYADGRLVLGQGDSNLANFLWDGDQVRLVDFEDSGRSDRAFELAILVEHISAWADDRLEAAAFLELFDLSRAEQARLLDFRRLAALFWLILLRPGSSASQRNPPGTRQRQAGRLLALLG